MDYVLTGKAARGLARILRGNRGNTGGGGTAYGVISPDDYALPFAVRWSAKESAWVIWLPSLAALVCVDGAAVTITGVAAAQNLPAGWYTVTGLQATDTAVYLNITIPDAGQTGVTTTAELSASPASSSTGNKVYPLTVATLATDATSGAKTVKQCLTSAVTIGGGAGGGGTSGTVSFVGDVKYDNSTGVHQIQQRVDSLDLATGVVTQGAYTMITGGQAVPLSGG